MENKRKTIVIEDTRLIYSTNFAGNPDADPKYHSTARRGNVVIPEELALELIDEGFNIKQTKPRDGEEEDFEPTFFAPVKMNFDSQWPPKVYLVSGGSDAIMLDENSVKLIDDLQNDKAVETVDVVLNPYQSQNANAPTLYVKTMYVRQGIGDDPFAAKYASKGSCGGNCQNCTHNDNATNSCEGDAEEFNEDLPFRE